MSSSTKTRFALAAALAVLSTPALATESAISGDPTWPAIENPAPGATLHAQGGGEAQALLGTDPLWPTTDSASPAFAVIAVPDEGGRQTEPVGAWQPTPSYAIVLSAPQPQQVAAAR